MNRILIGTLLSIIVAPTLYGQAKRAETEQLDETRADYQLKVFTLKNADAAELQILFNHLFDEKKLMIANEVRSNAIIARGRANALAELEALLLRLDEMPSKPKPNHANNETLKELASMHRELSKLKRRYAPDHPYVREAEAQIRDFLELAAPNTDARVASESSINGDPDWGAVGRSRSPSGTLVELRTNYEWAEQQAAKLAETYRRAVSIGRIGTDRLEPMRDRVASKVAEAFELRQQWQTLELAASERTLAAVRARLKQREAIKDKIIEHRTESLLSGKPLTDSQEPKDDPLVERPAEAAR